jgi:hypothetical protein
MLGLAGIADTYLGASGAQAIELLTAAPKRAT